MWLTCFYTFESVASVFYFSLVLHYSFLDSFIDICSLKIMAGPAPHTQLDADLAAGMGMPDNGPKLMSL